MLESYINSLKARIVFLKQENNCLRDSIYENATEIMRLEKGLVSIE